MLVGVLTLGIVTAAGIVAAALQPVPTGPRGVILVQPRMPDAAPLNFAVNLHVAPQPRRAATDDWSGLREDPMLTSKRRAFGENGQNCRVIGGQRCLSHPRTLLTLR